MRKITLLLAFMAFAGLTFAQYECELNQGGTPEKAQASLNAKAFGDVIWSEDFDGAKWTGTVTMDGQGYKYNTAATLPEGWVVFDGNGGLTGNPDYGYMHWSDVGPRGRYTGGPAGQNASAANAPIPRTSLLTSLPAGTSYANGFMMLESDWANTNPATGAMVGTPLDMDSYIQFGPIDFSAEAGAIFNYKTLYRYCCAADATFAFEVSSNYDPGTGTGDWNMVELNVLTNGNAYTNLAERDLHANVSKWVRGKSAVYFRLHQTLSSHYFWIIDDIKFYEPPVNDVILTDGWADYIYNALDETADYGVSSSASHNFWGGYSEIPRSIVAPFVQFRSALEVNGTTDAANTKMVVKIMKDEELAETFQSTPKTIPSFTKDTLYTTVDYTPAEAGMYQVSMTLVMDNADEQNFNNGWGYNFEVTKSNRYARVRHGMEASYFGAGPHDWQNGGRDGDACVQRFTIPETVESVDLKGISVYVDSYRGQAAEQAAIAEGKFSMIARFYGLDSEGNITDLGIASDLYTMVIEDTATWVTLDFVDAGNLNILPGLYWAGIETYTSDATFTLRFEIGEDGGATKQPNTGGLVYLTSQSTWYRTGDNYAIDLLLNVTNPYFITFNVDMSGLAGFDASTQSVYVEGSFGEKTMMTTTDNVNYTAVVPAADGAYTYKYSTTAVTENDNRDVTVAGDDATVNDDFTYVGIEENNLNLVSVYPNPFNGTLVLSNLNNVNTVVISTILGQTLVTLPVSNATLTVNTDNLAKGIYLVTIIDADNNTRTERVVKN